MDELESKVKEQETTIANLTKPKRVKKDSVQEEKPIKKVRRNTKKTVKKEVKKEVEKPTEPVKAKQTEEISVENNLRNIASIVKEEQDQLRIIEERTGEFKLDFTTKNDNTFIDEIDDSMSLDELMSLYEKKFKD